MRKEFNVLIEQDAEGYFIATVPKLRGCHTQAKSLDTFTKRTREAIKLCLEVADAKVISLMAIAMLIGSAVVAYAGPLKTDKFPCDVIKGNTYIYWISGTFDGKESAFSSKITFDKDGIGSTHEFAMFDTGSTSASILKRSVACIATPAGTVSVDGSPVSKWSLSYPEALVFITSYDNGSTVWINYAVRKERVNKGWMLQLPFKLQKPLIK
ncbi:MAG: type II toxin-antitoxin system HicB family antitoxin [Nitrospirota bacterium]